MSQALITRCKQALVAALSFTALCLPSTQAALTSLNDEPLATQAGTSTAPPNLMFVIDDSGSMDWDYMPGAAQAGDLTLSPVSDSTTYGYRSAQCNGLAYDPTQTYDPPPKWDGSLYPAASYTAVWDDGFNPTAPGGTGGRGGGSGNTATASSASLTYSTGSKSIRLDSGDNANLSVGSTIVVRDSADFSRWMLGTVTNVSSTSTKVCGFLDFFCLFPSYTYTYTYTFTVSFYTGKDGATNTSWQVFAPSTSNLGTVTYYTYSGSQTKMGWTYIASGATQGNPDLTTTYAQECLSHPGLLSGEPGDSTFTAVSITTSGSSAAAVAARQNYANWYQYYRERLLLMKTATGKSLLTIPSTYRVGITKISRAYDTTVNSDYFLQVAPFTEDVTATTQGQKYNFYAHLYGNNHYGSGGTPLRQSLGQMGLYYANKLGGQTDPMTAACQRNYTVLTTDGYWNDASAPNGLAKTGTGSVIGNTDGSPEVRPMLDGLSTAGTLADVAEYFYVTDLRDATLWGNCPTGTDVCTNDSTSTTDIGTVGRQNMVTYTLGLGVGGTLNYTKDYASLTTGDYAAIKAGTKNWPAPLLENATRVDDLWHAAVNGRGLYYGAQNANELATALESTVGKLVQTEGSGSAAAVSAFQLSSTDANYVYAGSYISGRWVGELSAYAIASDGTVASTTTWTAQAQLDTLANRNARTAPATGVTSTQCLSQYSNCNDERVIYFMHPSTKALKAFTYTELQSAGLDSDGKFTTSCSRSTDPLSQCTALSTAQKTLANTGKNLVNYLRGDITYEASNGSNPLYRLRYAALGDIANGTPAYAGKPPFSYSDSGYSDFVSAQSARTKVVYVAANDGMLHAFNALTGKELWAFVPNAVMPNLYKLADKNYSHLYTVDGSPVIADVKVSGSWKTILVGGLNKGGKAYYALDVTDPATPIPLWEYTHTNLGYTYGNPVVTKNSSGDWVVAFGSGYNNSGVGYLYVLDAYTGVAKTGSPISTATGTSTTPSGLAPINAWVDSTKDNTAQRIYGGDLMGNIWRFNINAGTMAPVATLTVSSTTPQPITVKPQLGSVTYGGIAYPVVMVGTGRYLHSTDVSDTSLQTIYAIKDKLDTTGWGDIRAGGKLVSKSVTTSGSGTSLTRTATSSTQVDWVNKAGWMLDLRPSSTGTLEGERVNTNMAIAYSTLVVATNIPSATASCRATGGTSWLYYLSLADGYTEIAPMYQGNTMISGVSVVYDSTGKAIVLTKTTDGDTVRQTNSPASPTASTGGLKRVSWRELVN